jgi:acetoin utilization deacetylase AcuC-like enzyme
MLQLQLHISSIFIEIKSSNKLHQIKTLNRKIAIVDFDVHHGNGTQEIVECLKPKTFKFEIKLPFSYHNASTI